MIRHIQLLLIAALVLLPSSSQGQWQQDGFPASAAFSRQDNPRIVSDGAGGAIITWHDLRNGNFDIYVQRMDAFGTPLWTADGVAVSTLTSFQLSPKITSDGAGGAIIVWEDGRNSTATDIYAQRVDASGARLWTTNGVAVSTVVNDQQSLTIVSDGAGGAIVSWQDNRGLTDFDIYSQRIDPSGSPLWTVDGVALAIGALSQSIPMSVADGLGGATVTWQDFRSGANWDIYARNISATGIPMGGSTGTPVCTASGNQQIPMIAGYGFIDAVVVWQDARGGDFDIYAQRITSGGSSSQWTVNGIALCTETENQLNPRIASDGAGGAIVVWQDHRNTADYDIYAQRVTITGSPLWTFQGESICALSRDQSLPRVVSDGAGGAVVMWEDERTIAQVKDIYGQRVDAFGVPWWLSHGVLVCDAANDQITPVLASDGAGNSIVAWTDRRSGPNTDNIYAQRVDGRYGAWGHPEPMVISVEDNPGDQGGQVVVRWDASQRDQVVNPLISYYSVWRSTELVTAPSSITPAEILDDPRSIGPDFNGSAIWQESTASGQIFWEWVANQNAAYQSTYSATTPTRADSVGGDPATHYFKVLAHETTFVPARVWESNVDSGHSVDNLAPAAPLLLTAMRVGADVHLDWNSVLVPDLQDYRIYRSSSSGVTPVTLNFLGSSLDTMTVDANVPATALYYIVTANDVHDNEGDPSNEASVSTVTGIGDTPALAALSVLPNHPNPFAGATLLRIGLPKASDITVEVYDVTGRRLRSLAVSGVAGWQNVAFFGHDDAGRPLPSGVYFYRISARGFMVQDKMVIAR